MQQVEARYLAFAFAERERAIEHFEQTGFAAACFADEVGEFALGDGHGDPPQHSMLLLVYVGIVEPDNEVAHGALFWKSRNKSNS